MTVVVRRECIGTGRCESKSAALRYVVKQPCEVGAVLHTRNLSQHPDGHLTREGATRSATYPARGFATRGNTSSPCGSFFEVTHKNTNRKEDAQFLLTLKELGFFAQFL